MGMDVFSAIDTGEVDAVRRVVEAAPSAAGARDAQGVSAVMYALYRQQHAIVEVLRRDVGPLDVFEAAALGDVSRLKEILDADDAAVNAYASDGFTPLHLAAFFSRENAVRVLLERGADVGAVTRNAMTNQPLHAASAGGSIAICRMIVDAGADVNARQQGGFTPLHEAALRGDASMVELYVGAGADASIAAEDGKTARGMAEERGFGGIAARLG